MTQPAVADSETDTDVLMNLGELAAALVLIVMLLPFMVFETWVAMTIWGWFSPWALPFTLVEGTGMNMAASTVFRSRSRADAFLKEKPSTWLALKSSFSWYVGVPITALFFAWVLRFFLGS
jgi:hypothetical protein